MQCSELRAGLVKIQCFLESDIKSSRAHVSMMEFLPCDTCAWKHILMLVTMAVDTHTASTLERRFAAK